MFWPAGSGPTSHIASLGSLEAAASFEDSACITVFTIIITPQACSTASTAPLQPLQTSSHENTSLLLLLLLLLCLQCLNSWLQQA
jgi:hypothetical protein